MIDLGTFPGGQTSRAYGINGLDQVVGQSQTASGIDHAFVLLPGEDLSDLGTLGGTSSSATDVNHFGEIVGSSLTTSGVWHATLWTIQPPDPKRQIDRLQALVEELASDGSLSQGQTNSVVVKLDAARRQLARDNLTAAANQLGAFINSVEALELSGQLGEADTASLIVGAQRLVEQLGG